MSLYGTSAIAAYNVGAQVLSLSFLPGIGFLSVNRSGTSGCVGVSLYCKF